MHAETREEHTGPQDLITELVKVLGNLVLAQSEDIKCLCSVVYETFRLPGDSSISKTMADAGMRHHEQAMSVNEKTKKGE
ncbi:MAG: hypothetical protein ACKPKO_22490 [Candidatus Fonsibacter sp.]